MKSCAKKQRVSCGGRTEGRFTLDLEVLGGWRTARGCPPTRSQRTARVAVDKTAEALAHALGGLSLILGAWQLGWGVT